jgi:alkanesulfonate monooxygenase SsuD/methylene tetrahydromethanopterin reductase-like flavin-dependent oxidoreductase (luciferase family)
MAPDAWYPDCWATIGAISAVTRRIRFSVAVYVLPLRNIFEVARATGRWRSSATTASSSAPAPAG